MSEDRKPIKINRKSERDQTNKEIKRERDKMRDRQR